MEKSKLTYGNALKALFVVAQCGLLVWWLARLDGKYDNEDFQFFEIILAAIGFPSTAVALVLVALLASVLPIYAGHTFFGAVFIWLVSALAAYIQWFVWVPKGIRRARDWWRHRPGRLG
jgi:hypothetical protein